MRPGSSPENLNQNGLRIVTFNYEMSFEYYFTTAIKHSFRLDGCGYKAAMSNVFSVTRTGAGAPSRMCRI
jgi:hypothetical protein